MKILHIDNYQILIGITNSQIEDYFSFNDNVGLMTAIQPGEFYWFEMLVGIKFEKGKKAFAVLLRDRFKGVEFGLNELHQYLMHETLHLCWEMYRAEGVNIGYDGQEEFGVRADKLFRQFADILSPTLRRPIK